MIEGLGREEKARSVVVDVGTGNGVVSGGRGTKWSRKCRILVQRVLGEGVVVSPPLLGRLHSRRLLGDRRHDFSRRTLQNDSFWTGWRAMKPDAGTRTGSWG
jgi:hypothetical protein